MPHFAYRALDLEGRIVDGRVEAASLDAVAKDLAQKGFTVQNLTAVPDAPRKEVDLTQRNILATDLAGPLLGKVDLADVGFFFRQLATMLSAGINPAQALQTLSGQLRSPKLAQIIRETRDAVETGHPISASLQRYPEVFTPLMVSLLRAGEKGGFLDAALTQIADYIEQEIRLRKLLSKVTFYPKLVIGASIVILLAANVIIGMLGGRELSSPLTRLSTWIILVPLIIGIFLFVRVGLQNARMKTNWDQMILSLPGLGRTSEQFAMAKFGRAFGALYKGGVSLQESFRLSADACGNEALRVRMQPAIRQLDTGAGVSETFRMTGAFNPIVLDMVATGEQTGNLDFMLNKMADFYEQEAEQRAYQSAMILGVVCLLIVGVYVAYIFITNLMQVYSPVSDAARDME